MNPYLLFVLAVILFGYLLEFAVSSLNLRALDPRLPDEFQGVFDAGEYARSQEYTRVTTRFAMVRDTVMTVLTVAFILLHGFNLLDSTARSFGLSSIGTGLVFIGLLLLLNGLVSLPFSVYGTFVIEERFGFNRTTARTFVTDIFKTVLLAVLIGASLLAFVLWFFEAGGAMAWFICWLVVILFVLVVQFLAPVVIMPLFNRFTPLADGELKQLILDYAREQRFALRGIYTMDGSKRSSRPNAFFTGFGRFRRIVFFDTLLEQLAAGEILAVLAHEMGHFKLHHIFRMMAASILQTGIMLFILSLFIKNRLLFDAFGMEHLSIYASLVFFGFLYAPISSVFSVLFRFVSRRHEYQADAYAVRTTGRAAELISGLKKLGLGNLANLTPHPLYVLLHYSHPPILERIRAIRKVASGGKEVEETAPAGQVACGTCGRLNDADTVECSERSGEFLCPDCLAEEESCGCED